MAATKSLGYRPALDGLRAIAVLIVVGVHTDVSWLKGGGEGVYIFFVLSGFLITTLLLQEHERHGGVALWRFFGRRGLRLIPGLYLMLAVMLVYTYSPAGPAQKSGNLLGAVGAATYIENWVEALTSHTGYFVAHTWSLGVEGQFYVIWPFVLAAALRRGGARGVAYVSVALAIASLLLRAFLNGPDSFARVYHGTDTVADQLLWGCALAAALRVWPEQLAKALRLLVIPGAAWLVVDGVLGKDDFVVVPATLAIASAAVVGFLIIGDGPAQRILGSAVPVWLGAMSYGIYLWHFPIVLALQQHNLGGGSAGLAVVTLVLAIMAAAASYYLLERPVQRRLRSRVAVPAATGTTNTAPLPA